MLMHCRYVPPCNTCNQLSLFLLDSRPGRSKMSDLKQLVMAKLKVGWPGFQNWSVVNFPQING